MEICFLVTCLYRVGKCNFFDVILSGFAWHCLEQYGLLWLSAEDLCGLLLGYQTPLWIAPPLSMENPLPVKKYKILKLVKSLCFFDVVLY